MGKVIVIVLAALFLSIIGIGMYLSPDDLRSCDSQPGGELSCSPADAIVAVSGGNTSVRAAEAITLYRQGWGDFLIFSGAAKDMTGPSNAEEMRRQAVAAGVPADRVFIDAAAQTTQQNARGTNEIIRANGIKTIILVTSPYHQRRALIEFSNSVDDNVQIRNNPAQNDPDWPNLWWLTPRGWWLAIGEMIKIMYVQVNYSRV